MDRELSRARRYRRALSLLMFDIDHFKKINDNYGHLAGDAVLAQLAAQVKNKIRREDVFARYGGEEFAILLPEIDLLNARKMGEKVRKLVEKADFRFEETRIPVTISLGVATAEAEDDAAGVIKRADEFLYEAKNSGRNAVRG
jgi:diguanylate cyclase (GGDEF)-like protein